jgi:hypothetical protein
MNAKNSLEKKSKQSITAIFKKMLMMSEDFKQDHDYHYKKLYDNIPEEYHPVISTANHFDESKLAYIRKRILDQGNECLRNFSDEINNYTVSFVFK